mgnify:FL=1
MYLLTAQEATGPIKAYSPELMVSDVYNYARISSHDETAAAEEISRMVARVKSFLPKLHSLTIGPGLGRHANVLDAVAAVITAAREHGVPLVIDADGYVPSSRCATVAFHRHSSLACATAASLPGCFW